MSSAVHWVWAVALLWLGRAFVVYYMIVGIRASREGWGIRSKGNCKSDLTPPE